MFVIKSKIDYQEYGGFATKKEARARIRELKRFDREQGNPFDEGYFIEEE